MALLLNKISVCFFLLCIGANLSAQFRNSDVSDYKDPKQFDRFNKRRQIIGAWQINQLKTGALVVRLKTDTLLIDNLKKIGRNDLVTKKRLETAAVNLNIIRAFRDKYKFSPVYFIYSHYSDSLLNGKRENIFIDTTLQINPSITMKEKFYLLAESDRAYNSTIGFVPEDSARVISEKGSASSVIYPIVIKNKYGHQLKKPFPYILNKKVITGHKMFTVWITINGISFPFTVSKSGTLEEKKDIYTYKGKPLELFIQKMYTYPVYSVYVEQLNENLRTFYQANPIPEESRGEYRDAMPFFY
jgi:hypothetical protein